MVLEGLRAAPYHSNNKISDEVEASVEALERLGLVQDRARVAETVAEDFETLRSSGEVGEPYIQLPRSAISLHRLIEVLNHGKYPKHTYPPVSSNHQVWPFGISTAGYKDSELDNLTLDQSDAAWPSHARLALYNHHRNPKLDELLHFLDLPYDEHNAQPGEATQIEAFAEAKREYESTHGGFAMAPLNIKAVMMIALTRRIIGKEMPVPRGYLRDATLPRKYLDPIYHPLSPSLGEHLWIVGDFFSSTKGELVLDWSRGTAKEDVGIGLSVGPKDPGSHAA